jgi:hypothetical protein
MPHTVQALPAAEAPGAERWRSIHFPTCATPFINEKQEVTKELTSNVCAHRPTALAYLLSKSMTHFHNQQYPEKKSDESKSTTKTTHIQKEPHDKRIMEAPTQE